MSYNAFLRLFETRVIIDAGAGVTGLQTGKFAVDQGSRAIFTLSVTAIDPGATVSLVVKNGFGEADPFIVLDTIPVTAVGQYQRVYSDFNTLFNLEATVTGGNASFKVVCTLNDNASTTKIENAQIDVNLDAATDPTGHHDSIRIAGLGKDGLLHEAHIEADGGVDVHVLDDPDFIAVSPFSETATPVDAGIETSVQVYTVPAGKKALLQRIEASGENIAIFNLYLNGATIGKQRTWFAGGLNVTFEFTGASGGGFPLVAGDVLELKVLHERPATAVFDSRTQVILKPV